MRFIEFSGCDIGLWKWSCVLAQLKEVLWKKETEKTSQNNTHFLFSVHFQQEFMKCGIYLCYNMISNLPDGKYGSTFDSLKKKTKPHPKNDTDSHNFSEKTSWT